MGFDEKYPENSLTNQEPTVYNTNLQGFAYF